MAVNIFMNPLDTDGLRYCPFLTYNYAKENITVSQYGLLG